MLKVGVIGYGSRASGMARMLAIHEIPYRVAAVVDPRAEEIKAKDDGFLKEAVFYSSPEEMLEKAELDGLMIGTRCYLHTPMACKVAAANLPLFLEKPVAITFDQVKALERAFRDVTAPVVVSFPLRVSPAALTVKQIIDSGQVGSIEHVIAFNDVPYGEGYYAGWYRNFDEMGGLFLQKATHDLDYVYYLLGQKPRWICAMKAQRIYGPAGTIHKPMPNDYRCVECEERETCPEGPYQLFHERFAGERVRLGPRRMCLFGDHIRNEDFGQCLIEYEGGAQCSYTQNFFARNQAGRRGARLYGYLGTIHFDWYQNWVKVYMHHKPAVQTIEFSGGMSHFGGDRELAYDFLMAMREGRQSRAPISAGILSALTCLWARESAETRQFCEVKMPE
jgi:predicted dehydrogenase